MRFKRGVIVGTFLSGLLAAGAMHSIAAEPPDGPSYEKLQLFADILTIVDEEYVEAVETKDLIAGALNGALSKLDPHSSYVPPVTFTEQREAARREYGGLGIEVVMEDGFIKITYALEEGPAYGAGIRTGDFITAVEGESIEGKTLDMAVEGIRGLAGDPINVTILTPDEESREVTVVREQVRGRAMRHRVEEGLGYIIIESFNNERLTTDITRAIQLLREDLDGDIPGFVIDLRGNRGGLLTQAVSVSSLFLDGGEILSV
ncbi:MAG: S41 family peptidase, partial [Pseudomonadota bacterium]